MNEALIRGMPRQQVSARAALGKQKVRSPALHRASRIFKGGKKNHPDGKSLIIRFEARGRRRNTPATSAGPAHSTCSVSGVSMNNQDANEDRAMSGRR